MDELFPADPELRLAIEAIARNAEAQAHFVEDLLDISAISTGQLKLNSNQIQLETIIHEAIASVTFAAEAKGVNIELYVLSEPSPSIKGDALRLRQVIWNLLSNAVKFTPRGGTVSVELADVDETALIRVSYTKAE